MTGPDESQVNACFINKTKVTILLIWQSNEGERSYYTTLSPGVSARFITYVGHVWVAIDKKKKRKKSFQEDCLAFEVTYFLFSLLFQDHARIVQNIHKTEKKQTLSYWKSSMTPSNNCHIIWIVEPCTKLFSLFSPSLVRSLQEICFDTLFESHETPQDLEQFKNSLSPLIRYKFGLHLSENYVDPFLNKK